jgi:chaperone BCS1
LSFALAGIFGLDIYVISLQEPTLSEEDLSSLFSSLPRRCVILLEDIDTAGLTRPDSEGESKEGEKGTDTIKVAELARELKRHRNAPEVKTISLSGLLNAIDGVASHEGRVLIMTTNKPETLDEALIRPGRVDLQIGFTNASPGQAQELFERMYEVDTESAKRRRLATERAGASDQKAVAHLNGSANGSAHKDSARGGDVKQGPTHVTSEELTSLAKQFAGHIPDGQFSPAEIQGFLLKRKHEPRRALEDVQRWADALLEQKATNSKLLQVQ